MKRLKRSRLARVKTYLSTRRAFGYQLRSEGACLLNFARYADQCGQRGPPSRAWMLRWARLARRANRPTWARRLKGVRLFAKYGQGFEPNTEVPPRPVFGPVAGRPDPYLYGARQIRELLCRARQLPGQWQPHTYAALLGLLACTGLRISEALGLRVADVDLPRGLLRVRESKYHKVRWIPLHSTTVGRLHAYLRQRRRLFPQAQHFLVLEGGGQLARATVERVFRKLRRGLAERGSPRLHDLRHPFAGRVLLRWQAQRRGAANRWAVRACYLGHNRIADTYWYLQAFPALLTQAGRSFRPLGK